MRLGKLERAMSKKDLTEQEIRSQFVRPAIVAAGWKSAEIREEYRYTDGRIHSPIQQVSDTYVLLIRLEHKTAGPERGPAAICYRLPSTVYCFTLAAPQEHGV